MTKRYDQFIFFSAGPVGDHALILDDANRFFESTGIGATIILKHYFPLLSGMSAPYPHIKNIEWESLRGKIAFKWLLFSSIWRKNCFVLVLPLKHPFYFKLIAWYVRFCTRSRMVGLNLEGSKTFPVGRGSASFLGKENIIPARVDTELFYEQANRMLLWLGCRPVSRPPTLAFVNDDAVPQKFNLASGAYIVMHLAASGPDRSLPAARWNGIIKVIQEKLPEVKIVFTGSKKDVRFVGSCIAGLPTKNLVNLCGRTESMQELLNVYAKAELTVCVHTGNAIIVNMLHVPTVMVAIKGVHMFNYAFNPLATILTATKDCTCDPYERGCTMIPYKGGEYMACVFNIPDADIVNAVLKKHEGK
ncbi:MAG: hypothetical protein KGH93_03495 [Patescibacteria group bacterium]|nr:hypothetical protein [Patescibacteria group bacterium]MDE1946228.1 hypothetical protein [Patescibacteria group bacterium]